MMNLNFSPPRLLKPLAQGLVFSAICLGNSAYASLAVDPTEHDFGQALVGSISAPNSFTITNTDAQQGLELLQAIATPTTVFDALGNISTVDEDSFVINNDLCSSTSLAGQASCQLDVLFNPKSEGSKRAEIGLGFSDATGNLGTVSFVVEGVGVTEAQLAAFPASLEFGAIPQHLQKFRSVKIRNIGEGSTTITEVALSDESTFAIAHDGCTEQTLATQGECVLRVSAQANEAGDHSATLNIISGAMNHQLQIPVSAKTEGWCNGQVDHKFSSYPEPIDFGTEPLGSRYVQWFTLFSWTKACDALKIKEVKLVGANADEFSLKRVRCYHERWRNESFSSCYGKIIFKPTAEGDKDIGLEAHFSQAGVAEKHISIQATAISRGAPELSVTPDHIDFGEVGLGAAGNGQDLTVTNTGGVNLHLKSGSFSLMGERKQTKAFSVKGWKCRKPLKPGQSCKARVRFNPAKEGVYQAQLVVAAANEQTAAEVTVSGTAIKPDGCNKITLQSGGNGSKWDNPETWLTADGAPAGRIPNSSDMVRINTGSIVSLYSKKPVKLQTLCVQFGGKLMGRVYVQASQYIENHGDIIATNGQHETEQCKTSRHSRNLTCAQDGNAVRLTCGQQVRSNSKAGDRWWRSHRSGCPIVNGGTVQGGNGGNGQTRAGDGGDAILLARGLTNTGLVKGGRGGNLTGDGKGSAGRGGSAQLWGKLGGRGHLFNEDGARAIGGAGGNANPAATAKQKGGRGGNVWIVSLPNVHLSGGIMRAGRGGISSLGGRDGRKGFVRIEPNLIDLSGATTRIEGDDVTIYGGNDWHLDLSNASAALFDVEGDLTISVGDGGSIDLTGAADVLFKAGGKVQIFADNITLDEDRSLEDYVQAGGGVVLAPAKILYQASLSGEQVVKGEPGETLTLNIVLANNGATDDTYTLSLSSSAAWPLGPFPTTVEVPALDAVELSLDVTLPSEYGASNTITVNAISQGDSNLDIATEVEVNVNLNTEVTGLAKCPESGVVSESCNNRGQVLRNAQVLADVKVEGGAVSGSVSNSGEIIAGITVQPYTEVNGGVLSGNVNNLGLLRNLTLRNGNINGGQIGGKVTAEGNSLLSDIKLLADTVLSGGQLSGDISSLGLSPDTLAMLQNLGIQNGSQLQNLIIGDNVNLPADAKLGKGILFSKLANIPRLRELLGLLPEFTGKLPEFAELGHPKLVDLSKDLVVDGEGILERLNALPVFKNDGLTLSQNPDTGALQLDLPPAFIASVHPSNLEMQDGSESGLFAEDRWGFRVNLEGGLSLVTQPALLDPAGFKQALQAFALSFGMTDKGDLIAAVPGLAKVWFTGRPDWFGTKVSSNALGMAFIASPHVAQAFVVKQTYRAADGQAVEQYIYSTPADAEALYAQAENVSLDIFGLLSFSLDGQTYQGVLEYLVIDEGAGDGKLSVADAGDLNGDGINDWLILYPQGETQVMYAKP